MPENVDSQAGAGSPELGILPKGETPASMCPLNVASVVPMPPGLEPDHMPT